MTQMDKSVETRRNAYRALSRAAGVLSIAAGIAAIAAWAGDRRFGTSAGAGFLPSLVLFLVSAAPRRPDARPLTDGQGLNDCNGCQTVRSDADVERQHSLQSSRSLGDDCCRLGAVLLRSCCMRLLSARSGHYLQLIGLEIQFTQRLRP